MNNFQRIKTKDVIKYVALPGIVPRVKKFAGSGFSWLAQLMAIIYQTARLLPPDHPYLNPENVGKFGIRHVITEAAGNLKFTRGNIDQIIVFFALLMGFIVLILQFVVLMVIVIIKPAFALPGFAGLFATPGCVPAGAGCPDIAFGLLDLVFGVPDMFNSNFAPPIAAIPALNLALQSLFQFYSWAILLVAIVIIMYYVFVIVGETAQTGTPFGKRFAHLWAPFRLVVALALLVPINYGYNSGQYMALFAARTGSGLATNSWYLFNRTLSTAAVPEFNNPSGMNDLSMVARPNIPNIQHFAAFMTLVNTCRRAYDKMYVDEGIEILPYLILEPLLAFEASPLGIGVEYEVDLGIYENQDIIIRFGYKDNNIHGDQTGGVYPYCGEIKFPITVAGPMPASTADDNYGPWWIQAVYYHLLLTIGWDSNADMDAFAERMTRIYLPIEPRDPCAVPVFGDISCATNPSPTAAFKNKLITDMQTQLDTGVTTYYDNWMTGKSAAGGFAVPDELLIRGWGGAGIWYNKIAQWNGSMVASVINVPIPTLMPSVMEHARAERRLHDENVDATYRFEPYMSDGEPVIFERLGEADIAKTLNKAYLFWIETESQTPVDSQSQGNIIFDALGAMLGIEGLFTMRENKDIHPLAQLSTIGKGIIEAAIRNLITGLAFSAAGGMAQMMNQHMGDGLSAISSIFIAMTTMGLTIGFVLYYVLAFLPFIYFYFAVGDWVKTIFEAMVGVPLWALAHLRIDGDGLPGDAASNGYFLMLEIFIRPILIIFGLIASMIIFTALARVLNELFPMVVENLSGFDTGGVLVLAAMEGADHKRSIVDEFFFTIVYAILIYMIATSAFKLIDQIPDNILRWIGAGVKSFGDQTGDPTQGLVQYAAMGSSRFGSQAIGAASQGARTAGMAGGHGLNALFGKHSTGGGSMLGGFR